MIGIDTNVLVRYLTRDDEQQWERARQLIEGGETGWLADVVLCELVWVLRGRPYQYSKAEIVKVLELLLRSEGFEFENRSAVYQAWQRMKAGKADFSDYLIGALSRQAGCAQTVTFDRKLRGEPGWREL